MFDIPYEISLNEWTKYTQFLSNFTNDFSLLKETIPDYKKLEFQTFLKEQKSIIEEKDKDWNYNSLFKKYINLLDSLERTSIDGLALKTFQNIEKNETILSNLKTFEPKGGKAKKVVYNLKGTSTGRLTVKDGPSILTLPKRHRSIIKSRHKSGKIINVDFVSLEPRFARAITGNSVEKDVYNEILGLTDIVVDRSVIKQAVLSSLYGSTKDKRLDKLSLERSNQIMEIVWNYFDLENTRKKFSIRDKWGYIRNYFGRPLMITSDRTNVIYNNYVQSSCVDISLQYFYQLVNDLKSDLISPLFILHDALILDVSECQLEAIKSYIETPYEIKNLGHFYLDMSIL